MAAVSPAVCEVHIGEGFLRWNVWRVDPITNQAVGADTKAGTENAAADYSSSNIDDIIRQAAPIGKSSRIASNQPEAAPVGWRSWGNAGVEPQKVRNRSCGRTLGGDRRGICHQRQQIRSRWSRNVDPVDRVEDSRDERVKVERGKLTVVHRLGHAPVVLAAGTDNQFVDEWIAK